MTASAAAGRPATKPPLDTSNYTDLMLRWVRPGTALHRCLLAQRASPTAFAQKVRALSPSPIADRHRRRFISQNSDGVCAVSGGRPRG